MTDQEMDLILRRRLGGMAKPVRVAPRPPRRPPTRLLASYAVLAAMMVALAIWWVSPSRAVVELAVAVLAAALLPGLLVAALTMGERVGLGTRWNHARWNNK
jgi:nitroreductase